MRIPSATRARRTFRRALPLAVAVACACAGTAASAQTLGRATAPAASRQDTSFAATIARLSEPGGYFDTDNLISNEASYEHVLGALDALGLRGGVYIGVGPDQNFTYIAALRPRLAIIVDIRRDNLLEQLLFRALFQLSRDRTEFLGLLLGRPLPAQHPQDLERIVSWADSTPMRQATLDSALAAVRRTVVGYGVPLSQEDLGKIERFHTTFARAGLGLRFETFGRGSAPYDPTLRDLLLERDLSGHRRSYLADDGAFQYVRGLQVSGRIIPVVGDLAGTRAFPAIAAFLRERNLPVTAYYVSNVEFYLAREAKLDAFVANLRALPRAPGAVLIRSAFRYRLPQSVSGYASTQLLQRIDDLLAGWSSGRIRGYEDMITVGALPNR